MYTFLQMERAAGYNISMFGIICIGWIMNCILLFWNKDCTIIRFVALGVYVSVMKE